MIWLEWGEDVGGCLSLCEMYGGSMGGGDTDRGAPTRSW